MPLAFDTLNHGKIAFGFFNIHSDMLLLERYFFFASQYCSHISSIARQFGNESFSSSWKVDKISKPEDMGDLMGAIHGVHYSGFIGETYKKFPFPERREDFKQQPEGFKNQHIFEQMISPYATKTNIILQADKDNREIAIGSYKFSLASFQELLRYVWVGGYPRWKDDSRPAYVEAWKTDLVLSDCWLFDKLVL